VRVSMGAVFSLPYARAESWPAALDDVAAAGFTRVALTPADDAVTIEDVAAARHARLALLFGSEGPGLTDGVLKRSDVRARIPMSAGVDSLNVAAAAAVTFYVMSGSTQGSADR
jgi:tRNA G18 (ribose-2'-O)-methylase SpoU